VPVVLALLIDTSSAAVTAAVACFDPGGGPVQAGQRMQILAERVTIDARAHGELLAPSIAACLDEVKAAPADLGAVIVGLGPGPFTGLRVGLVTAAALADALHLPTYGVCSLDAVAAGIGHPDPLLVAGDARRREVYWATYEAHFPDHGGRVDGPEVARAADVPHGPATAMAGAGARLYRDQLGLPLLDPDYPTARGLALLAADRVLAGAPSETLVPLYLRRPDAVAATSYKTVTPPTVTP
jgi:tRNA threonylcarbamoyl adenosine modification protein YeaZ